MNNVQVFTTGTTLWVCISQTVTTYSALLLGTKLQQFSSQYRPQEHFCLPRDTTKMLPRRFPGTDKDGA